MLVPLGCLLALVMIINKSRHKSVPISNRSHARRVNSGKITVSKGGNLFDESFKGNLLIQCHEIWSQN